MKKLPNHWHIKQDPVCPPQSVVKGDKWRISVLTPSLLRLEYSADGIFEDRATQFALNRNFPPCPFNAEERNGELLLSTEKLFLRYDKKPFSKNGLCVKRRGNTSIFDKPWHYGDELSNLGGTVRTLDGVDGSTELEQGILSVNGISAVDDSLTLALDSTGWVQPRQGGKIDIYVFAYGRDYRLCLKDFFHLTGPAPLLPRYALGNWWSRFYRYTEQSYKELIERFEKEKIPFSVSVIDMDWHLTQIDPALGNGWTGFTWNRELFPDPKRFLDWLHGKNLHITLNLHPADGIRAHEEAYSRMAALMGVDANLREPVEFDASNPDFLQGYFKEVLHPMEEDGVDFWWVDWQQGDTTKVSGLDPLWVLNHFHYLDNVRKSKRPLTFSRYAGLGSHRYPVGFSGDTIVTWASLEFQPYFTATASNAGYGWWSHDIGGHMGGIRDDELTVRWVQFGVFSPISRLHSSSNPFNSKEPWHFNLLAQRIIADFLRLRHRLVPYLYSMNRRASCDGEPLVQPMYYAEPDRPEAYRVPNEYYFGSELICCPITAPVNRETQTAGFKAWLPPGTWHDFFNGRIYSGGRILELWRTLDVMPVLAKAGGIVPLAGLSNFTNSIDNPDALEIYIFAGDNGSFSLWEDSGTLTDDAPVFNEEDWAETLFTLDWDKGKFVISPAEGNLAAIPVSRSWTLRFCGFAETKLKVFVNGKFIKTEPVYDKDLNRISLFIEQEVSVDAEIIVEFDKPEIAKNDINKILFNFLDNAWIEYETKRAIYQTVKNSTSAASVLAALKSFDLPALPVSGARLLTAAPLSAALYSNICEILCAFDGGK